MKNIVSVGIEYPYATITEVDENGYFKKAQILLLTPDFENLKELLHNTKGRIIFDNNDTRLYMFLRSEFGVERLYMDNLGTIKGGMAYEEGIKVSQKIKDDCPYNLEAVKSLKESGTLASYAIMKRKQLI